MTKSLPLRDLEALSAYVDEQLSPRQTRKLETRLKREPDLQQALEDLRRTRRALRAAPRARAPRNFTLTPEMAGYQAGQRVTIRRGFQAMRLVAVAASVMLAVVFAGDLLLGSGPQSGIALAPAAEPAAELYSMDEAVEEPVEEAEAPLALEAAEPEAPEERAVETEAGLTEGAPDETGDLEGAAPKAAVEETAGDDIVGGGVNGTEMTGTPTLAGTPIPPGETQAPTEPPPPATDSTQAQIVEATEEAAPPDIAAAPPEGQVGAIEEEEMTGEVPVELEEPRAQFPPIRMIEGGLALIALISGGLALYLRRRGG